LWFAVRSVLHLVCAEQSALPAGKTQEFSYKLLVTDFLSFFLHAAAGTNHNPMSDSMLTIGARKLARRQEKLRHLAQFHCETLSLKGMEAAPAHVLAQTKTRAKQAVQLATRVVNDRWALTIRNHNGVSQSQVTLQKDTCDPVSDTKQTLTNSKRFLDLIRADPEGCEGSGEAQAVAPCRPPQHEGIPSGQMLLRWADELEACTPQGANRLDIQATANVLYEVSEGVRATWRQNTDAHAHFNRPAEWSSGLWLTVLERFIVLGRLLYTEEPRGISQILLTSFAIFSIIDGIACSEITGKDKNWTAVKPADDLNDLHADFLQHLLLPDCQDVALLEVIERRTKERLQNATKRYEEFTTKYCQHDANMRVVLQRIKEKCATNVKGKEREYEANITKCHEIAKRITHCSCSYIQRNGRRILNEECDSCIAEDEYKRVHMDPYEKLLPNDTCEQRQLVFELCKPQAISDVRDALHLFRKAFLEEEDKKDKELVEILWRNDARLKT
jgi:hypothetical protein